MLDKPVGYYIVSGNEWINTLHQVPLKRKTWKYLWADRNAVPGGGQKLNSALALEAMILCLTRVLATLESRSILPNVSQLTNHTPFILT